MNYLIEGIVSELSIQNEDELFFRIQAAEGFSLRIGKKKYNVLIPFQFIENEKNSNNENNDKEISTLSIIISQSFRFSIKDSELKKSLIKTSALGHRVEIIIEIVDEKELSDLITKDDIVIKTITVYSE
ncbi:MAG: hypothetical protein J6X78_01870 [Treponema sp.]|nr:hypothetical protein [Treponema sp.]